MYANLGLFIDGQWLNGDGRRGEDVITPATEKPLARLPHATDLISKANDHFKYTFHGFLPSTIDA